MKEIFKGIFLTLGILSLFGVVFAVGFHTANEITSGIFNGDYIFNNNVTFNGNVTGISSSGSIPSGAIMAFYLTTCPNGWKAADGTNSTPDLRGVFLRGMESFNEGISSGTLDPDRTGSETLGSYQADELGSHTHSISRYESPSINSGSYITWPVDSYSSLNTRVLNSGGYTISSTGGAETRPKNIAVLYCIKE